MPVTEGREFDLYYLNYSANDGTEKLVLAKVNVATCGITEISNVDYQTIWFEHGDDLTAIGVWDRPVVK